MVHGRVRRSFVALVWLMLSGASSVAVAQPGGGGPLPPPLTPPGNPTSVAKVNLGKALFWDEQLSSTRTVACGTCHMPEAGGSDFRKQVAPSLHPGIDGVFGTPDDVVGSAGVPRSDALGLYTFEPDFGLGVQVTARDSRTVINAAYSPELFWDGRAPSTFVDPVSGQVVLFQGAALESQAAGPPLSDVEMAHAGRDWLDVEQRVEQSSPLALSPSIPQALSAWIAGREYPALFQEAFGTPGVTAARIAMAIATYERTLFTNQTPLDQFLAGNQNALTLQEQQGRNLFGVFGCAVCHGGNLLSDNQYHYIGVRPQNDDLGRFLVTAQNVDRGAFRTPTLRNVELTGPYFHNGRTETLEDVVDFYNRGGDFTAPNKPPVIRPLNMTPQQRAALLAFLRRPLTDPRVQAQQAPFDRPTLYIESDRAPVIDGVGSPGPDGIVPQMIAIEPPLLGNPSFTVALLGGAFAEGSRAVLVIDDAPLPVGGPVPNVAGAVRVVETSIQGDSSTGMFASASVALPDDPALLGVELFARWYVIGARSAKDPRTGLGSDDAGAINAPSGDPSSADAFLAASPQARFTMFAPGSAGVFASSGKGETRGRVDLAVFLNRFATGDDAADLAPPYGVLDNADIAAFLAQKNR